MFYCLQYLNTQQMQNIQDCPIKYPTTHGIDDTDCINIPC